MVVGGDDVVSAAVARSLDAAVLETAVQLPDAVDGVVFVIGADATTPLALTDLDSITWKRLAHGLMRRALDVFQQARVSMRERGGRIVVILPTIGVAGSPMLVPYTTALEGIRAMAKSAARQWAASGVTVNMIGIPVDLISPDLASATTHLTSPAITESERILDDVIETTRFLLRRDIGHLVGQTVIVDGGSVMLP